MIYQPTGADDPIKQGDIFYPVPNIILDLDNIPSINDDSSVEVKKWEDIQKFPHSAALAVNQAWAIVASQDCDTSRAPMISFFIIKPFTTTSGNPTEFDSKPTKWWMERLTKKSKDDSGKWFYLPPDETIGFDERMVAVFQNIIQIPRESLESRKSVLRKGRLNQVADEHFRESIAQFFRRYPYNEWYPLNKDEFSEYLTAKKDTGDIPPYDWQVD